MGNLNKALFSSNRGDWETPQDLFDALNKVYRFTLDAAASAENAKCARFFTVEDDGLSQSWGGETVFCNPPYGREIGRWVEKAWRESQSVGTEVVLLLPARTDTAWFYDYCKRGEVTFLRGRLKFGGAKTGAPFPSMLVRFGRWFVDE